MVEGRLNRGFFAQLKVDQEIIWINSQNRNQICKTKISAIRKYKSFKEMLENETLKKTLPNMESIDEGVNIYRKYYKEKNEKEYGVIAIELTLENKNNSKKIHEIHLNSNYYYQVKSGEKPFEIRINDQKRQLMNIGDYIEISCRNCKLLNNNKPFKVEIIDKKVFHNFKDALEYCSIEKAMPELHKNGKSIQNAIDLYEQFPHDEFETYKKGAEQYGVAVFELKVL